LYLQKHPNASKATVRNVAGQIWRFVHDIQKGDLIALPLKKQKAIAMGQIEGDYEYRPNETGLRHIRRVSWVKTIPRSRFDQDLLYSLGSFMTVCQISRNDAENRILKLLDE
jgi:restriction system protein